MEEVPRRNGKRQPTVFYNHIRDIAVRRLLAENADRAVFHGGAYVFVSVRIKASDGDKQAAGACSAGIIRHIGNIQLLWSVQRQDLNIPKQFTQLQ